MCVCVCVCVDFEGEPGFINVRAIKKRERREQAQFSFKYFNNNFLSLLSFFLFGKGYINETIKQADVVLLGFPLGFNMSADVRRNDLTYYGI